MVTTTESTNSLRCLLQFGEQRLATHSPTPKLDAEVLLAFVAQIDRYKFLTEPSHEVASADAARYRELIERRRLREPVAYLTGVKEFYSRDFSVTPAVLIPRPESELVIDRALEVLLPKAKTQHDPFTVLDLGVGSGCLLLTLVAELKARGYQCEGIGIDISSSALEVAKINCAKLGVSEEVTFHLGSWFEPLHAATPKKCNLIISNPPYVGESEEVSPETQFEPSSALFAAEHGLQDVRTILEQAPPFLEDDGVILIEVGAYKRKLLQEALFKEESILSKWSFLTLLGDGSEEDRFTVIEGRKKG